MRAGWLRTSAIPVSALARWPSVLVCVRINIILYYVNVFTYYYNIISLVYTQVEIRVHLLLRLQKKVRI